MADGVTIPASGTGTATPVVATDDAGAAGHVQIIKLAISTDASATLIPADATDGLRVAVVHRAVSPQSEQVSQAALGAGSNVDLTASDITTGTTGYLHGVDVGASVPLKCAIQTVSGTRTTRTTIYVPGGSTVQWRTPAAGFITQAGGTGNAFGVSITSLVVEDAADVIATLYWEEI